MSEDPSKRTPPPISSNDPRRQTGRYGPNQNAETTKLEAAPAWAISMQESINSQFTSVNAHLDLQDSAFDGLQVRVGVLEAAAAKNRTGPQRSYSGPIQALQAGQDRTSQNDLRQDAELAETREWRDRTGKRLDAQDEAIAAVKSDVSTVKVDVTTVKDNTEAIKDAVSGFLKEHPQLSTAIVAVITGLLMLANSWIQTKGHP